MTKTITQNNVDFTNVNDEKLFMSNGKYSHASNNDGTGKFDTTMTGSEITKSFNAIEIDWNGAQVDNNTTINSTGDLINWIKRGIASSGDESSSSNNGQENVIELINVNGTKVNPVNKIVDISIPTLTGYATETYVLNYVSEHGSESADLTDLTDRVEHLELHTLGTNRTETLNFCVGDSYSENLGITSLGHSIQISSSDTGVVSAVVVNNLLQITANKIGSATVRVYCEGITPALINFDCKVHAHPNVVEHENDDLDSDGNIKRTIAVNDTDTISTGVVPISHVECENSHVSAELSGGLVTVTGRSVGECLVKCTFFGDNPAVVYVRYVVGKETKIVGDTSRNTLSTTDTIQIDGPDDVYIISATSSNPRIITIPDDINSSYVDNTKRSINIVRNSAQYGNTTITIECNNGKKLYVNYALLYDGTYLPSFSIEDVNYPDRTVEVESPETTTTAAGIFVLYTGHKYKVVSNVEITDGEGLSSSNLQRDTVTISRSNVPGDDNSFYINAISAGSDSIRVQYRVASGTGTNWRDLMFRVENVSGWVNGSVERTVTCPAMDTIEITDGYIDSFLQSDAVLMQVAESGENYVTFSFVDDGSLYPSEETVTINTWTPDPNDSDTRINQTVVVKYKVLRFAPYTSNTIQHYANGNGTDASPITSWVENGLIWIADVDHPGAIDVYTNQNDGKAYITYVGRGSACVQYTTVGEANVRGSQTYYTFETSMRGESARIIGDTNRTLKTLYTNDEVRISRGKITSVKLLSNNPTRTYTYHDDVLGYDQTYDKVITFEYPDGGFADGERGGTERNSIGVTALLPGTAELEIGCSTGETLTVNYTVLDVTSNILNDGVRIYPSLKVLSDSNDSQLAEFSTLTENTIDGYYFFALNYSIQIGNLYLKHPVVAVDSNGNVKIVTKPRATRKKRDSDGNVTVPASNYKDYYCVYDSGNVCASYLTAGRANDNYIGQIAIASLAEYTNAPGTTRTYAGILNLTENDNPVLQGYLDIPASFGTPRS